MWLVALAHAAPTLDANTIDWVAGAWISRSPVAYGVGPGNRVQGSHLAVVQQQRFENKLGMQVFQAMQRQSDGNGPTVVLEEIWCDPRGAFLQVWQGTDGGPVRLAPTQVADGTLVFEGDPGRFPTRVELHRTGDGLRVVHQGPWRGAPLRVEWTYGPQPKPAHVRE